jgi:glycosyltransferase involved in cell wall biosynthesis
MVTVITSTAKEEPDLWLGRGHVILEEMLVPNLRVVRCPIRPVPGGWRGLVVWRSAMVMLSALPGSQANVLIRMALRVPWIQGIDEAIAGLKTPVDVVHGFNISWEHALLQGWQYARSQHLPFVITPFAHLGSKWVALKYVMDHQKKVISDADALLAMTAIEVEGLRKWGVSIRQAAVIGAGLNPLPPAMDGQEVLASFDLAQPYILFIGRTSYDKGAIHAAQAVLALREQNVQVNLVLAGRVMEEFDRFYQSLTDEKKQFLRPLGVFDETKQQELHALIDETSMVILPSRMDSFGLVFLEAWAHGKAVIGARAGGIPGVVDDGENGILVNFGDVQAMTEAVRLLLIDQSLRHRLGENGRLKVSTQYNWEQITNQVLAVYETVLRHL